MSANIATVAYLAATILLILSLGGLSSPETSRRGNLYGIIGMINFAHGEVFMIGAFISLIVLLLLAQLGVASVPLAILVALVLTAVFTALWGFVVERIAYRPLRGSFRLARAAE